MPSSASFFDAVFSTYRAVLPFVLQLQALLIPFIVLEQIVPARERPGFRDYTLNILIVFTTLVVSLPLGMLAGMGGAAVRQGIGLQPIGFSFGSFAGVPYVGGALEIVAIVTATMLLHDLWFYWSHRLEHRIPVLWAFHRLHHGERRLNATTWARDHFLQSTWRGIFPVFTFGLLLDLEVREAGQVAVYAIWFTSALSMFYHSAARVRLPWLDWLLVTPQVHRIHHSTNPEHYNSNFADFLPIFDIVFGTYRKPAKGEFPATGLGDDYEAPRNVFAAQAGPVADAVRALTPRRRRNAQPPPDR